VPSRRRAAAPLAATLAAATLAGPGIAVAVVGGGPADPAQWPFVVPLLEASEPDAFTAQFCAGSLVAPDWVLTAAHCVEGRVPAELQVARPRVDLRQVPAEDRIGVDRVAVYPSHETGTLTDDLALVHLTAPAGEPADLARGITYADGARSATVAGWGIADPLAGSFPDVLMSGQVSVLSQATCALEDPDGGTICATIPRSAQPAACRGDSGGPLAVAISGKRPKLLGVVSYGDLTCAIGNVGVYADVGRYRSWIVYALRGGDPAAGMPELDDVDVEQREGRVEVRLRWCQPGPVGHRVRVDVGLRGDEPATAGRGFLAKLRRKSSGGCASVLVRRPAPAAGRYAVTVKIKDLDTLMVTPPPEVNRGPVRITPPAAA
jgi:hypothetical protein